MFVWFWKQKEASYPELEKKKMRAWVEEKGDSDLFNLHQAFSNFCYKLSMWTVCATSYPLFTVPISATSS
jgi:hypothetical protein